MISQLVGTLITPTRVVLPVIKLIGAIIGAWLIALLLFYWPFWDWGSEEQISSGCNSEYTQRHPGYAAENKGCVYYSW